MTRRRVIAVATVPLVASALAAAPAGARTTAALHVEAAGAPQRVHGSDGREHVEYDLVVTNVFSADATLTSLEVHGDGRRLLTLRGDALAAATRRLFSSEPTTRIAAASTAFTQVDVVLPRSAGRTVPGRVTNRITYVIPAAAPSRAIIGTTTIDTPALRVGGLAPVVISPPLEGAGWVNANGCCDDPTSPHRSTVISSSDGAYVAPETFAVDWVRLAGGLVYRGDGKRNSDWPAYGAPLYAVADGTVVSTADGKPDIPPFENNPGLKTPKDYAGNFVILKIAAGRYAAYAHLQPGSVRVRPGQRVRAGQQIGVLGNSGNTSGPHLHFGIQARPDPLSDSLPFEFDRFTLEGNAAPTSMTPRITVIGPARRESRSHPLIGSVATFAPGTG